MPLVRTFCSRSLNAVGMVLILGSIMIATDNCSKQQAPEQSPRDLVPDESLGWTLQDSTETYDREGIFDYIDGAGEVYRAYGFAGVTVFRYDRVGEGGIIVEIFDMGSPADAYGVFSYSREEETSGIGQAYEFAGSLLHFWKDRFYVCVRAEQPGELAREAVVAIAKSIDGKITAEGGKPALVGMLPQEGLVPHSETYFHTHPVLNNRYFVSTENILNLGAGTNAVLARYSPGRVYLLCIEYKNAQEAEAARQQFVARYIPEARDSGAAQTENGLWVAVVTQRQYLGIVFDAPDYERAVQLADALKGKV
ncbi:MAG TPA: DUF6599 family protein [Candidatus Deferrimicrobium sp.]|nr:DUF6599 family protein [Candidatus Deferrimicrobium sp.]